MRIVLNPRHPNNDWYEELCALGAIGELSSSEFEELQQHLAECGGCRQLYADFRRIASDDLGSVAVLKRAELTGEADDAVNEHELLSRLLDRANRERAAHGPAVPQLIVTQARTPRYRLSAWMIWLRRPALSYGSLVLILCAVAAVGAYRLRERQLTPALERLSSELGNWESRAQKAEGQEKSAAQSLQQAESQQENLQKELADAEAKYAALQAEQKSLQAALSAAHAQLDEEGEKLASASSDISDRDKQLAQLQNKLDGAVERTAEQERIAGDLRNRLQGAEQASNTPESQGFNDADAKGLFGARDLHIVDVYDVDSNGKNRRTYGRVYYAEKKLLIFYAFDLQDAKHNRAAAGFQAWGYREANQNQPESLGLFNLDDASMNRWVLKVSNPRVLERIDAVYVTLEPPNGSPTPLGRRLLYANLIVPPNHP
jgi:Skp family chaperone for outer membrane proteins